MNKRDEARGALLAQVRVSCPESGEIEAGGLDISASGISFLSDRMYPAGQRFQLTLALPWEEGDEGVELLAELVRCDATGDLHPYRVAAHFVDLDPNVRERLRYFVAPDVESVEVGLP